MGFRVAGRVASENTEGAKPAADWLLGPKNGVWGMLGGRV